MRARWGLAAAIAGILLGAPGVRADVCMVDSWDNGNVAPRFVFPNWVRVPVASFDVLLCNSCAGASEILNGLTVVNYGTAVAADVKGVSWQARCGATVTGILPMTFAGSYAEDAGSLPAWTWGGASVSLSGCADLCGGTCGGYFTIDLYADIDPCPAAGTTIKLGFPIHAALDPIWWGSIRDNNGCVVPWYDMYGPEQTITYVQKDGPVTAAPGDTVTYTVTYGRPGVAALSSITVMDTQPPYTHYVTGSAVPAPDAGFDPDWGPPTRLKWTVAGPLAVTGGPTGEIRFGLTVDWGNGESFEPGSGDVAAPEGKRLDNQAQVSFNGTSCAGAAAVTPPVTTVVRRFLYWMLGDNDLLFSGSPGVSPDEMIYSTFIRNMSASKTWWNVSVWDTVPAELDPWCANCGLDDPCAGWTMTPTGCAAYSPRAVPAGGRTLLTWRLDMPPGMTLELRWKAQVQPGVTAGATAINQVGILELGRAGIVDGTGFSVLPGSFAHAAQIILPTTFISYVGFAGGDKGGGPGGCCPGFFLALFPLNKKTQFEVRAIQYETGGWAAAGGVSASIGCLIGDCIGGFPGAAGCALGSGAILGGGIAGCKIERIPAKYDPPGWVDILPGLPFHFIYKLTSNSPVVWQFKTKIARADEDNMTYAPSASLSYAGMIHYSWRRYQFTAGLQPGDEYSLISTGTDVAGAVAPTLQTTVHLFKFDYTANAWGYIRSYDLAGESEAYDRDMASTDDAPWRFVSSNCRLVIADGCHMSEKNGCCCSNCANDDAALMPDRDSGNVITGVATGMLLGLVQGVNGGNADYSTRITIGNTGSTDAVYEIWRYLADNTAAPAPYPPQLWGTSGTWSLIGVDTVPAGLAAPGNPRAYDRYNPSFNSGGLALYRLKVRSGGPIQALGGIHDWSPFSGGSVVHSRLGGQTGTEFWMHHCSQIASSTCGTGPGFTSIQTINVFCPKTGMAVQAVSENGYTATYTTSGPDQCVSFTALTDVAAGGKRNYRVTVLTGERAVCQFIACKYTEKGYTAPFLVTGTHYQIIAPPVVFSGQSFWLTIVVIDATAGTKTDYCGTTSFTSTDPTATVGGTGLAAFDFTWSSATACTAAPDENGVKVFVNVIFSRLGLQSLVASDTQDGSITGLAAIMVVGADVKLFKEPRLAVGASGDTVSFRVCWSNYSSASAFTFVITDAVPMGTTFLPEAGTASFDCGNTAGIGPRVAYSTAASTTPPAAFTEANPLAGTRWLRFTIPQAGVNTTGCVCYRVTVN